jgi:aspartate aminotransferase
MIISEKMQGFIQRSSWIRKMFEEGLALKKQFGADKVCDFSLGNPDINPPEIFYEKLAEISSKRTKGLHAYMPNAGHLNVREKIAGFVQKEHEVNIKADEIIMTVGAAGGLNIIFKALLNPDDEVIVPAPYFVEYGFYVDNHNGKLVPVPSKDDFSLDFDAIKNAITSKTRIVLINSPNNPSGKVYSENELAALSSLLAEQSKNYNRDIILVSDEPYRRLMFDGKLCPPLMKHYNNSIVTTSFSKDLSIPGERIGFVAAHPDITDKAALVGAMTLANRILGYVNAPSLMQHVVGDIIDSTVDMSIYQKRRDLLSDILKEAGFEFQNPEGSFYFFPKTPIEDDTKFVNFLKDELILTVPGSGFGLKGHFRVCFCVDATIIERSREGFKRAYNKARA